MKKGGSAIPKFNRPLAAGFITDWLRPDGSRSYGAVGWYRVINPMEKLGYKWYGNILLGGEPEQAANYALSLGQKAQIWLFKPVDNTGIHAHLAAAKDFTQSKLVLDLDDEPFTFNRDHPLYDELVKKSEKMKLMLHIADHVIVTNQNIKQAILPYGKPVTVIPNAIDPAIWNIKKPHSRKDGKIRIGWFGSGSHVADTPVINKVFDEILAKYPQVEIHLAGFTELESQRGGREFHHRPTMGYKEYPQFLADMDMDIAVAPLLDTQFNRAKTPIKFWEHGMLETPMVLSNVTPYKETVRHGVDGYLASNHAQWVKYLSFLIENADTRKKIGKAAKQAALKHDIKYELPKYEEVFKKLMDQDITVYTALTGFKDELNEKQKTDGAKFVAFTDQPSETWEVRKPYTLFKDERRNSRIQKLMPHLFFDTEFSIYLDANFELTVPPQQVIDEFLIKTGKDIAVFKHGGRTDIYQEGEAVIALQKEDPAIVMEQMTAYAKRSVKPNHGLNSCGIIIRRHTPKINACGEKWWAEYCRYSKRDQMSFNVSFPKSAIHSIEWDVPEGQVLQYIHPYFKYLGQHKHEL